MKRSFREQQALNNAATEFYAMAARDAGKEPPKTFLNQIPQRAARVNHSPAHMLEAAVMVEVKEIVRLHPKVLFAIRQNSGETEYTSLKGDPRRVRYYDWIKRPPEREVLVTDIWGMLRSGRMFAIDAKRRDWRLLPSDDHAQRQLNFINAIIATGGVGGFACSAEQALTILDAA